MEYNTEKCKNIKITIDNRDGGIHGTEDLLIDLFHYMVELYKSGVAINMVELDMLVSEDKGEPLNYPKPNINIKEYGFNNTDEEKDEKAERALRELNEFLENNINKRISLDELTDLIKEFCTLYLKVFKRTTDLSPIEFYIFFRADNITLTEVNTLLSQRCIPYRIDYIQDINKYEVVKVTKEG